MSKINSLKTSQNPFVQKAIQHGVFSREKVSLGSCDDVFLVPAAEFGREVAEAASPGSCHQPPSLASVRRLAANRSRYFNTMFITTDPTSVAVCGSMESSYRVQRLQTKLDEAGLSRSEWWRVNVILRVLLCRKHKFPLETTCADTGQCQRCRSLKVEHL